MGVFTEVKCPIHGVVQFKVGDDHCRRYLLGEAIDHHLGLAELDGIYDGIGDDEAGYPSRDYWVVVKDKTARLVSPRQTFHDKGLPPAVEETLLEAERGFLRWLVWTYWGEAGLSRRDLMP